MNLIKHVSTYFARLDSNFVQFNNHISYSFFCSVNRKDAFPPRKYLPCFQLHSLEKIYLILLNVIGNK